MATKQRRQRGLAGNLNLSLIKVDQRLQCRAEPHPDEHIHQMAEAIKAKVPLPRVKVVVVKPPADARGPNNTKPDPIHYLVGGFGRIAAYMQAGRVNVPCEIFHGTWEDAVAMAAAENQDAVQTRRTNADKRRACEMMIQAHRDWSNGRIADHIGVSHTFVSNLRAEMPDVADQQPRVGKDERKRTAPAPRKKKEKAATGWFATPLSEFLVTEDVVLDTLEKKGVMTAGQLSTALGNGLTFGFKPAVLATLRRDVDGLRKAAEAGGEPSAAPSARAAEPTGPHMPWDTLDAVYGQLVRLVDRAAAEYEQRESLEYKSSQHQLSDLYKLLMAWKKKLLKK